MKPNKKSHISFCENVADGASYKMAYLNSVANQGSAKKPSSDKTCEQNGSKLAKQYASYIQELKEKIGTAIDKAHETSVLNGTYDNIMSKAERMHRLTEIAKGNVIVRRTMPGKDADIQVEIEPDHMSMIKAMAELNKMDGSYSPTKIAETDSEGKDKPKLDDQKIKEVLKIING